jgi:hypothetical protein
MKPSLFYYSAISIAVLATMGPIVWHFYWPTGHGLDVAKHQIGRDFINLWAGPQLAFSGRLQTLFDLDAYHQAIGELFGRPLPFHNWGAPPFMLVLLWPLSQMPYFVALALWTALTLMAYLWAATFALDPSRRLQAILWLTLSPAALINIIGGQNGFLTAALFLGGILAMERRPYLAGALFGVLTVKPHLGLVLPFVLLRSSAWRTILAATVVLTLLVLMSIALLGLEPWRQFLTNTRAYQVQLLLKFEGFYVFMMASVFTAMRSLGAQAAWASLMQALVAVLVILATTLAWGRTSDRIIRCQLIVSAATLVTPYIFLYDLTALSAVVVWRLLAPDDISRPNRMFYTAVWLSPWFAFIWNIGGIPIAPLIHGAVFLAALRDIRAGTAGTKALEPRE